MSSKSSLKTFFYIGLEKLSLLVFEGINKKIFEKELLIAKDIERQDLDILIDNFFGENIMKAEKKINSFINEIDLITFSNFLLIEASIKKKRTGNKIDKRDLNHMLFELKQQIKENNIDKTITHMRIKSFLLDKKKYLTLYDNIACSHLCFKIDFIFLPNKLINELKKKKKKYHVNIDKIFSAKYLKEYHNGDTNNVTLIAARLKYDRDENEVHLIKKNKENTGFFERFFKFFN